MSEKQIELKVQLFFIYIGLIAYTVVLLVTNSIIDLKLFRIVIIFVYSIGIITIVLIHYSIRKNVDPIVQIYKGCKKDNILFDYIKRNGEDYSIHYQDKVVAAYKNNVLIMKDRDGTID